MTAAVAALKELAARVRQYRTMSALIMSEFEMVDDYAVAVRRDDIAKFVAAARCRPWDTPIVTNVLRREVRHVVRRMGGVVTRAGNRRIFRRVKWRSESIEAAQKRSAPILNRK